MSKYDPVKQVDQQLSGGSSGTVVVTGSSGSSNADMVDGFHAEAAPVANKLLALNGAAQYPASVIDWSVVDHHGLRGLADNDHTQYLLAASVGAGLAISGQGVYIPASIAGAGLDYANGVISVNVGAGLRIVTDSVAIDAHDHQTNTYGGKIDHGAALLGLLDDDHTQYSVVTPLNTARNTIVAGAADVTPVTVKSYSAAQSANLWQVQDYTGAVLLQVNKSGDFESANFQSGIKGWQIAHDGVAEFQNAHIRGELHAAVFVKDLIEAHAGTLGIFKSGGKLAADFTTPAVGSTVTICIADPPTGGLLFSNNDWVRIKCEYSGGVYDIWGQVSAGVDNGDGTQGYTYTHRSGTESAVIRAGVAVSDYGASGQGYIIATADLNYAPYIDIANWSGGDPFTAVNHSSRTRIGLLDGISGIGAEWGLWAGKDADHYLLLSDQNAVLKGIKQQWTDVSNNVRAEIDPAATGTNALAWFGPSSSDKRFIVQADGAVVFRSAESGARIQIDASEIAGYSASDKQFYVSASDGKAYFGAGNCIIDKTGLMLKPNTVWSDFSSIKWKDTSHDVAAIASRIYSGTSAELAFVANSGLPVGVTGYYNDSKITMCSYSLNAGKTAQLGIIAANSDSANITAYVTGGVNNCDGTLSLAANGSDCYLQVKFYNTEKFKIDKDGNTTVKGGLNVGSATDATTGQIRASDQLLEAGWLCVNNKQCKRIVSGDDRAAVIFGAYDNTQSWFLGQYADTIHAANSIQMYGWNCNTVQMWHSTGNVTIGNTTDYGVKLGVNGKIRANSGFNYNGTDGNTSSPSFVTSVYKTGSSLYYKYATLTIQGGIITAVSGETQVGPIYP